MEGFVGWGRRGRRLEKRVAVINMESDDGQGLKFYGGKGGAETINVT